MVISWYYIGEIAIPNSGSAKKIAGQKNDG